MSKKLFFIFILSLFVFNCSKSPEIKVDYPKDIAGSWEGVFPSQPESEEKFVFEFLLEKGRIKEGIIHTYSKNVKVMEMPVNTIIYTKPDIRLVTNSTAEIKYQGTVNPAAGEITGKLIYPDGSSMEMNLIKINSQKYKGASARQAVNGVTEKYIYSQPEQQGGGWKTASLASEDLIEADITEMVEKIIAKEYGLLHSLLIVKNNKLVLEEYFFGYDKNTPHLISSTTKSVSSLLIGIAADQGLIKNTDEKIFNYFTDYEYLKNMQSGNITLNHLLTMTAGFQLHEDELYTCEDRMKCDLERQVIYKPGVKFQYDPGCSNLLAGVIKQVSGMHADKFADKCLFQPLRIKNYNWEGQKQNGYPLCQGSLELLPRDMAKIGQLILQKGKWEGKQIVSEDWIKKSIQPGINKEYGFMWWLNEFNISGSKIKTVSAIGIGSQFIIVAPSLDMVIVTTGGNFHNGKTGATVKMLRKYLMKSIQKTMAHN